MRRQFAKVAFSPSVQNAQARYGSRNIYKGWEDTPDEPDELGPQEKAFIEARDSFYQASASTDGWPYVQFRGGPKGFLKVLDSKHLAYADFRGNVQYISAGNIAENGRVALILMDYPNQRRLKIWAHAKIVDYKDDPELVESLEVPSYRARTERAIILQVEALNWNCPQHITPRFSEKEMDEMVRPLVDRIAELEAIIAGSAPSKND